MYRNNINKCNLATNMKLSKKVSCILYSRKASFTDEKVLNISETQNIDRSVKVSACVISFRIIHLDFKQARFEMIKFHFVDLTRDAKCIHNVCKFTAKRTSILSQNLPQYHSRFT